MQKIILLVLFFIALVAATGDKCPKVSTTLKTTDSPCNNNNKCVVACGKYSGNKCQGFGEVVIQDTKMFSRICPFEGARLVRATSIVKRTFLSTKKDSISTELVAQKGFWEGVQDYLKTFAKVTDRVSAEKKIIKDVTEQYKAFQARRIAAKTGEALKKILANKVDSAAYNKKVEKLIGSITVVALSRKCLCNSFLKDQYKPNAPQTEKDLQWTQGSIVLGSMMNSCKTIPAATDLCKKYKITGKDLSCAILPDEKGCLPIFEKLYETTLAPLKGKLSHGKDQGVKERKVEVVTPMWLKNIQLEQEKTQPKKVQVVVPPVVTPKPVEAPKTVEAKVVVPPTPPKPVDAPKQAPQTPPTTPKAPEPVKPVTPVPVKPVEPVKPKIAPLIVPKVPKKPKVVSVAPTAVQTPTKASGSASASGTASKVAPPVQVIPTPQQPTLKVPTGPKEFVGQKKKIKIHNQV